MNYEEAAEAVISKQDAIREIEHHSIDPKEFFEEVGEKDHYIGSEVLNWLGY